MNNIFKLAAKNKFRFPYKGNISIEDLFDLTTTELDKVYKELMSQTKNSGDSLLDVESNEDRELNIKIEIVKEIFNDKIQEMRIQELALVEKQKRERIKEIIAKKKDEDLSSKSIEELEAMLNN